VQAWHNCYSAYIYNPSVLTCSKWYSTAQFNMVWYGAVGYSTAHLRMVWYSTAQFNMVWYGAVGYSTAQFNMAWYSVVGYSTAHLRMVWYSTAQSTWYGTVR